MASELQMSLIELKQACKIINDQPDKIRRSIEPAHEELLQIGYLAKVVYIGKGAQQEVAYTFSSQLTEEEPHLAFKTELEALGLRAPSLRNILGGVDADEVRQRITKARQVLDGYGTPPRNSAAVAADVLKNPGKYEAQAQLLPMSHASAKRPGKAVQPRAMPEVAKVLESVEDHLKTLRFLLKSHLSVSEVDALQAAVQDGRIEPAKLIREASSARAALGMQAFVLNLKERLV